MMGQNFSQLEYGNCRDLTHVPMPMFNTWKSQYREEKTVLARDSMLQTLLFIFRAIIGQVVANRKISNL